MQHSTYVSANNSRGVALLEVLLSSFIMTTGILAALNMQTFALGLAVNNSHLLQAEWSLNDMMERMKANPAGFEVSLPTLPRGRLTAQCETMTGCTSAELAAHDLARWHQRLETLLPSGAGEITPAAIAGYPPPASVYRVQVQWQGQGRGRIQDGQGHAAGGDALHMPVSSGIVVL